MTTKALAVAACALLVTDVALAQTIEDGVLVPEGFVRVWEDDRLNPKRGIRTAAGDARMALIWTDDVPQKLLSAPVSAAVGEAPSGEVFQLTDGVLVQVATYPDSTQAALASVSLSEQGIPSRRGVIRKGNDRTPVLMAGPYASADDAARAAAQLRQLGFPQAFVRN